MASHGPQMEESPRTRIVSRRPFGANEGASGAMLERAALEDGSVLILKTFDPAADLTMQVIKRAVPLEVELWQSGVLERLPPPLSHAVVGAWQEEGVWVVAMRDLGASLLTYDSLVDLMSCRRILSAAHGMHQAFRGQQVPGLWPLERRLTIFAPNVMAPFAESDNALPRWVLSGWERFDDVVPGDVASVVHAIHENPALLAEPLLRRAGGTLLHGDYWMPNIAPEPQRVVAIDWALATYGPPVVEFTSFLVGCSNQVAGSKEDILDVLRDMWAQQHDERELQLGLIGGLVELGWNLAWHVVEHPDDANRRELDWWVEAARRGIATGLLE